MIIDTHEENMYYLVRNRRDFPKQYDPETDNLLKYFSLLCICPPPIGMGDYGMGSVIP